MKGRTNHACFSVENASLGTNVSILPFVCCSKTGLEWPNSESQKRNEKEEETWVLPCHVGHACDEIDYIRLCLSSLVSDSFVCLNNSSHADFTRATCNFLWSVHMQTIQSICLFCSCVCTTIYDFLGFHDIIHLGDENYKWK